jgi:salicylate hydroxylase
VAILGGGIGGLALALALSRRQIACTVFEKDEDFSTRRQGYGFTLQQGKPCPAPPFLLPSPT